MPNYRRFYVSQGTYFITQVTYKRQKWLCSEMGRKGLREAIEKVREKYFFSIDAFILLPDHFHCLFTLPENDDNISVRLKLIKTYVSKHYKNHIGVDVKLSRSGERRGESNLWQRRFWEHCIRNEQDLIAHYDYIHYNPVKHGLCNSPQDWPYSTIHRLIKQGVYPADWGKNDKIEIPENIGKE